MLYDSIVGSHADNFRYGKIYYLTVQNLLCAGFNRLITSVVVGPALLGLIITARCMSAITIMKLKKKRRLLGTHAGNDRAHSEVLGRLQRQRKREVGAKCTLD